MPKLSPLVCGATYRSIERSRRCRVASSTGPRNVDPVGQPDGWLAATGHQQPAPGDGCPDPVPAGEQGGEPLARFVGTAEEPDHGSRPLPGGLGLGRREDVAEESVRDHDRLSTQVLHQGRARGVGHRDPRRDLLGAGPDDRRHGGQRPRSHVRGVEGGDDRHLAGPEGEDGHARCERLVDVHQVEVALPQPPCRACGHPRPEGESGDGAVVGDRDRPAGERDVRREGVGPLARGRGHRPRGHAPAGPRRGHGRGSALLPGRRGSTDRPGRPSCRARQVGA